MGKSAVKDRILICYHLAYLVLDLLFYREFATPLAHWTGSRRGEHVKIWLEWE